MTRRWLRGVVVDGAGAPVPGAYVVVVEASVPVPEIALVADAQGGFAVNLPEGTFLLRAEADGRSGEGEVTVPATEFARLQVG
jgi:hypothetical protein